MNYGLFQAYSLSIAELKLLFGSGSLTEIIALCELDDPPACLFEDFDATSAPTGGEARWQMEGSKTGGERGAHIGIEIGSDLANRKAVIRQGPSGQYVERVRAMPGSLRPNEDGEAGSAGANKKTSDRHVGGGCEQQAGKEGTRVITTPTPTWALGVKCTKIPPTAHAQPQGEGSSTDGVNKPGKLLRAATAHQIDLEKGNKMDVSRVSAAVEPAQCRPKNPQNTQVGAEKVTEGAGPPLAGAGGDVEYRVSSPRRPKRDA